jgi:hypothetical protein
VPVGVPVSSAKLCRTVSFCDGAWSVDVAVAQRIRKKSAVWDLALAPVTPEAAGSSPVDPANLRSRLLTSRELRLASHAKVAHPLVPTVAQCATAVPDSQALLAARAEAAIAAKAVTAHYLTLPTYEPRLASPHRRSYGRHDQPLGVSSFCGAVVRSAYVPGAEATKTNWRRAPVYVWRAFTVIRRRFVASA